MSASGFIRYLITQHRFPNVLSYLRSRRIHRDAVLLYDETMLQVQSKRAEDRLRALEVERQKKLQEQLRIHREREFAEKEARARADWADMHRHVAVEALDALSGCEFEEALEHMFRQLGFAVRRTKESGDQGADLIVEQNNRRIAVQAKRYTGSVGNGAVQELLGAIAFYECQGGIVITTAQFTKSARKLAEKTVNVELWPREKLREVYCRACPADVPEFSWEKYELMEASARLRRKPWPFV